MELFLTSMQIYEKLAPLKNDFDLQDSYTNFNRYVKDFSEIQVTQNPEYDKAIELMMDDEIALSTKIQYENNSE